MHFHAAQGSSAWILLIVAPHIHTLYLLAFFLDLEKRTMEVDPGELLLPLFHTGYDNVRWNIDGLAC